MRTRLRSLMPRLLLIAWGVLCVLGQAEAAAPDELVRETADEVMALLRSDAGGDLDELAALVDTKVVGHFDFASMTRLALGKYWRQATAEEQMALVGEFRTLLVRTYSNALLQFLDYDIETRPLDAAADAKTVIVRTLVSKGGSKPIHLDYRMMARDADWFVFDVMVDGVSLVVNYRSMFGATVEKSGVAGLIRLLQEKNGSVAGTG